MARIRTIKPEAFENEDLATVDVTAERTFIGSLTLADDRGRLRDNPAILAGRLWALRSEHTAAHVAQDLSELAEAGLICRYTGCNGKLYFHVVTFAKHQKIDRPSASRLPRCPEHQTRQECGGCREERCPEPAHTSGPGSPQALPLPAPPPDTVSATAPTPMSPARGSVEPSAKPRRALDLTGPATPQPPPAQHGPPLPAHPPEDPSERRSVISGNSTAGQVDFVEASSSPRRSLDEGSPSGSRNRDQGSVPEGRPAAPASAPATSAKELVTEYVAACAHRPPKDTLGHLGRKVGDLLAEGFEPETIRTALARLRAKGLHPGVLPSLVNEVLNADPPSARENPGAATPFGAGHTPYFNPSVPAPTTFGVHR